MTCPSCGHENRDGRKFCAECGSPLAAACPSCGASNEPGEKFCGECGAALTGAAPQVTIAAPAAERRLVSVLFADLVGFTGASESRDAEDSRDLLPRYFESARTLVERYGGTVEKFIGDAVMAVWGTPVAQEDDAERAVRAALDLVAAVPELDSGLRARAGVLTGEAAVTVGAEGQGMVAGDLVNTASRVQSAADPGTVLVGEATRRASEAAIAYTAAGEHELKGKAEPLSLWKALRVVAHRGGAVRASALEAPFVGRDRELRLVKDFFHGTADDGRASLVTVVGVAGIGKSRLAWELEKHLDGLVENVWWHRGRCLAYGEGVAFWALAEMVRMRAGIVEDEPEEAATGKLAAVVAQHVPDHGEREWVEPMLRHLLGLGERPQVERTDLFSAWRLFIERMSDTATVALVFEDLHWADTALLDFVEHLLEWSRARPIFVLALTRPELIERRGDFGTRSHSSTRLVLEPLSDDAMEALLEGLVPGLPDDLRSEIRERADGIPLYAVETVRMLLDRGALERDGETLHLVGDIDSLDVPETLHALIAARLDGLPADERRLIQHAAILGKTFAARGVAALGGLESESLEQLLDRLVRKEILVLDANPRSPERGQYGFLQALVQRVAYDTLSKKERGRLHRAAASYLEHEAGIDPDEISEVIAAHYRDAFDTDPAGEHADSDRDAARAWLVRAGERAAALGAPEDAQRAFDDAAAITHEPIERAALLERAGQLARTADRIVASEERLREAVDLFTGVGDTHAAARAAASLGLALWQLNRADDALSTLRPAFEALADEERDADVGRLAAEIARIEYFAGESDRAREHVEIAIDLGEAHGELSLVSQALNTKALVLGSSRPHEQHALLQESLRIAEANDLVEPMLRSINNLIATSVDRPNEELELLERGLSIARARGQQYWLTWFGAGLVYQHFDQGDWAAALAVWLETQPEDVVTSTNAIGAALHLAMAGFEQGNDDRVRHALARIPPDLLDSVDLHYVGMELYVRAVRALTAGRLSDAIADFERVWRLFAEAELWNFTETALAWAADGAALLGDRGAARPLAEAYDTVAPSRLTRDMRAHGGRLRAFRSIVDGDEDGAADAFADALAAARSYGRSYTLGGVLADYGVWLAECGRGPEAEPLLDEAQALWERTGATRWLELIEAARERIEVPA